MEINSVLGKISTDQLGTTLMHEHVICIDWRQGCASETDGLNTIK